MIHICGPFFVDQKEEQLTCVSFPLWITRIKKTWNKFISFCKFAFEIHDFRMLSKATQPMGFALIAPAGYIVAYRYIGTIDT